MKIPRLVVLAFTGIIGAVSVFVLACLIYIHINREQFIQYFLDQVNENLTTPVEVGKIDISYWENFPQVSIVLEKVKAGSGSHPLLSIEKLSFGFTLWDFLNKNYYINQLYIAGANLDFYVDKQGRKNFDIFKNGGQSEPAAQVALRKLKLVKSRVRYEDERTPLLTRWTLEDATFDFSSFSDPMNFSGSWNGAHHETVYQGFSYLKERPLTIALEEVVLSNGTLQQISKWTLTDVSHQGTGHLKTDEGALEITWTGKTSSLKDLLANLPVGWPSDWASYALEGEATFDGAYEKENKVENIQTSFQGTGIAFQYPSRGLTFSSMGMQGSISTDLSAARTRLTFDAFEGKMNDFPIKGSATVTSMGTMHTRAELEGEMNLSLFEKIMPDWGIKSETGDISYALGFEGRLDAKATGEWLLDGEATLSNATFMWQKYPLKFEGWNGTLLFNDRDVAITETSGRLGNSRLQLDGLLRNFHFFYGEGNNLLLVEGNVSADRLDLNELLADNSPSAGAKPSSYSLSITPRLHLALKASAGTVVFDRFTGTNLKTNFTVRNRQLYLEELAFNTMGGSIQLSGNLSDQPGDTLLTYFSGDVKNLYIDSAFYVFHDFDQTWLQSRHLRGQIDADFTVELALRNNLTFMPDLFRARIDARGVNGELVNFEPMLELSRLVKEEKLVRLTFGEINNQFLIEGKKIIIPSMLIKSNVSNITLSGTHTFDQQIDYRLKVPIVRARKRDKDEAFGAIEEDEQGRAFAYVKITGTTDDYKVAYDGKTAAKSIIENIKGEGRELRKEINNEAEKKPGKTLQLKEDDFFEFEEDTVSIKGGNR